MLEVSEKYREMAESDAREVSVKVNIGDIELTNDDIIDLNIYRSMGESGFSIGGVVTTRIRLLALMNLPYAGEVAMDVSVGFGFDEENASEYVQLGRFYGCATNPSFDTAQVEIIGYDKLGSGTFLNRRFHEDFAPEFPCTVQEILDYICQRSNLECDFTCNNYSVSELPLKDKTRDDADYERYYTYKEMLGFVAAAHGAVAAMDSNNKLVFLSVGEETETVDSADCIDFAFKSAEEFTVKGILLHVQDVLSTGSTNIFINDDSQVAYDGETTDGVVEASCPFGSIAMAEELWQQLGGFSYYSCEFTRRGRGWTELGDVIYANDSLSGRTLLKHEGKMIAQTVEWNFSAAEGFMEHIISKAESPEESTDRLGNVNSINNSKDSISEKAEKIKFVRNNVEYGAVGIHDYVPSEDGGENLKEAHRKEGDLWFLPCELIEHSSNVLPQPFEGIYFQYPYKKFPLTEFNSAEDISDSSFIRSTIFANYYSPLLDFPSYVYISDDKWKIKDVENIEGKMCKFEKVNLYTEFWGEARQVDLWYYGLKRPGDTKFHPITVCPHGQYAAGKPNGSVGSLLVPVSQSQLKGTFFFNITNPTTYIADTPFYAFEVTEEYNDDDGFYEWLFNGVFNEKDVSEETGIALSITEVSNWLALLDENGEKILEYVPNTNKREEGKPYEVKKGLWFCPVKSQKVPDFNGFYFPYPANFNELRQKGEFDPSAVDEASPFYSIVNSTMFCLSDAKVNELRNAGFKHVYNAGKFKDDIWEINGYESAFTYMTGMNGVHIYTKIGVLEQSVTQASGISWESIIMPVAPYVPVEENGDIVKYQGSTGEIIASSAQEGHYTVVECSPFNCSVNSEVYKKVWKDVIEAAAQPSDEIPKGTIRIYKDIFLMNGAKILNEDV